MANYEAPLLQSSIITTYRTAGYLYVNVGAGLNRRIELYECEFGQYGTLNSTDCQMQWDLSRFGVTALLTGAAVVPNSLDPADTSPVSQFYNNASTEPTYTAAAFGLALKNWAINQRGFNRWRALDDGDRIIVPATAMNGVGIREATSTSAFSGASAVGNISFVER